MNSRTKKQVGSVAGYVGLAILLLGLITGLLYLDASNPNLDKVVVPEQVFVGMQIVLGVGILLVLLMIVAIVYARLDLADPKQALGLPEGTVRALIALILLLVFIICGLWILRLVGFTYYGLTMSADGIKLAQQLITTIGTLVVAVAGFYFGTTAVTAARDSVTSISLPLVRSINPTEGKINDELSIKIVGKNFRLPKTVRLVNGSNEIIGTDVLSSDTEIQCKIKIPFDVQVDTIWDLNVVNEDGGEDTLPKAFTVKSPPSQVDSTTA